MKKERNTSSKGVEETELHYGSCLWLMGDAKWRALDDGSKGTGKCKGRVTGRLLRWIIDERPSRDEGLDDTWWDWLIEVTFFGSLTLNLRLDRVANG